MQERGDRGLWGWILGAALANGAAMFLLPSILLASRSKWGDVIFLHTVGAFFGGILLFVFAGIGLGALVVLWRVFAGRRPLRDLLRAAAWGGMPIAASLPFTVAFIIAGSSEPPGPVNNFAFYGLWLWGFVLSACTLAEVHEVTTGRGLAINFGIVAVTTLLTVGLLFGIGAYHQAAYGGAAPVAPSGERAR